jgi:hypothetical protein
MSAGTLLVTERLPHPVQCVQRSRQSRRSWRGALCGQSATMIPAGQCWNIRSSNEKLLQVGVGWVASLFRASRLEGIIFFEPLNSNSL